MYILCFVVGPGWEDPGGNFFKIYVCMIVDSCNQARKTVPCEFNKNHKQIGAIKWSKTEGWA